MSGHRGPYSLTMREDDYAPGEAWIIETLTRAHDSHGWIAQRVERDAITRGIIHVRLTDHHGKDFHYRIFVVPEETAIRWQI